MWNTATAGPSSGWRVIFQFGLELHLKRECLGIFACLFLETFKLIHSSAGISYLDLLRNFQEGNDERTRGKSLHTSALLLCVNDILIDFRPLQRSLMGFQTGWAPRVPALPGDLTSTHSKQLSLRCPSKVVFERVGDPGMELPCAGKLALLSKLFF